MTPTTKNSPHDALVGLSADPTREVFANIVIAQDFASLANSRLSPGRPPMRSASAL